jgi:hypothetical protein
VQRFLSTFSADSQLTAKRVHNSGWSGQWWNRGSHQKALSYNCGCLRTPMPRFLNRRSCVRVAPEAPGLSPLESHPPELSSGGWSLHVANSVAKVGGPIRPHNSYSSLSPGSVYRPRAISRCRSATRSSMLNCSRCAEVRPSGVWPARRPSSRIKCTAHVVCAD